MAYLFLNFCLSLSLSRARVFRFFLTVTRLCGGGSQRDLLILANNMPVIGDQERNTAGLLTRTSGRLKWLCDVTPAIGCRQDSDPVDETYYILALQVSHFSYIFLRSLVRSISGVVVTIAEAREMPRLGLRHRKGKPVVEQ